MVATFVQERGCKRFDRLSGKYALVFLLTPRKAKHGSIRRLLLTDGSWDPKPNLEGKLGFDKVPLLSPDIILPKGQPQNDL